MARRQIVERQLQDAVPALKALLASGGDRAKVQAIWALVGLGKADADSFAAALAAKNPAARMSVLLAAQQAVVSAELVAVLSRHQAANEVEAAALARTSAALGWPAWSALDAVLTKWSGKSYVGEAALAGLGTAAGAYAQSSAQRDFAEKTLKLVAATAATAVGPKPVKLSKGDQALFDLGKTHYSTACIGCHGADGQGLPNLGAPLAGSEWVTGDDKTLAKILLAGMRGPIHVAGVKLELPLEMPGSMQNPAMDDKTLAAIATYMRNEWGNRAPAVKPETIKAVRDALKQRGAVAFTEEELKKESP
jgi:mono/diheme cytochrome c family protein